MLEGGLVGAVEQVPDVHGPVRTCGHDHPRPSRAESAAGEASGRKAGLDDRLLGSRLVDVEGPVSYRQNRVLEERRALYGDNWPVVCGVRGDNVRWVFLRFGEEPGAVNEFPILCAEVEVRHLLSLGGWAQAEAAATQLPQPLDRRDVDLVDVLPQQSPVLVLLLLPKVPEQDHAVRRQRDKLLRDPVVGRRRHNPACPRLYLVLSWEPGEGADRALVATLDSRGQVRLDRFDLILGADALVVACAAARSLLSFRRLVLGSPQLPPHDLAARTAGSKQIAVLGVEAERENIARSLEDELGVDGVLEIPDEDVRVADLTVLFDLLVKGGHLGAGDSDDTFGVRHPVDGRDDLVLGVVDVGEGGGVLLDGVVRGVAERLLVAEAQQVVLEHLDGLIGCQRVLGERERAEQHVADRLLELLLVVLRGFLHDGRVLDHGVDHAVPCRLRRGLLCRRHALRR
mmetsp:Transcript_14799/g.34707  ORF Transcript_14799/g.34707 Transcript_14799/m.34707 type:complete len:457 (+) Transcript_14799:594-1964(+)